MVWEGKIMYEIKAHEVMYKGAHFRSKNECKRYIFLKELGWNIEYEPVLEDVKGWLPDLIIFGCNDEKILVERTDEGQKEDYKKGTHQHCGRGDGPYYGDYFVYTDNGCNRGDIDICDQDMSYHGLVHGSYDGGWSIKDDTRNKIETSWNKAGTEMRYVKRIGEGK